jgi:hypothetical protein
MAFTPAIFFHIWAGTVGLLAGAAALSFRKGSRLHRISGNVFFVSMLVMSGVGAYGGYVMSQPNNVVGGVFTFYLVATAWLTVARKAGQTGLPEVAALSLALTVGASCMMFGWEAAHSASGMKYGMPAGLYFAFGILALICAAGDIHMFVRGGIAGARRIARHLWRMCFALFFATASLFLGQQQVFPAAIRKPAFLALPVVAVLAVMIFWLLRILFTKAYRSSPKTNAPEEKMGPEPDC